MGVTAAVIGGLAAVGTAVSGEKQRKEASKAGRQQEAAMRKQEQEMRDRSAIEELEAGRDVASARQRRKQGGMGGRQGTILTSPLGVPNAGTGGGIAAMGKTLLGQ